MNHELGGEFSLLDKYELIIIMPSIINCTNIRYFQQSIREVIWENKAIIHVPKTHLEKKCACFMGKFLAYI